MPSDWQYDAERERRINELRKRNGAVCMPDLDYIRGALAAAREALDGLVTKLDEIHANGEYKSVWTIAQMHRGPYQGPKYDKELDAARAVLGKRGST